MTYEKTGSETLVNVNTAQYQTGPRIVTLAGGDFVTIWQDSDADQPGGAGFKGRVFATDGTARGGEFRVVDATSVTALPSGGFVVVGDSRAAGAFGLGQVYDGLGQPVGGAFTFAAERQPNSDGRFPSVGALDEGGFVVAWHDVGDDPAATPSTGLGIYAQRFDTDASSRGGTIVVNGTVEGVQGVPRVLGLAGGGFVIGWTNNNTVVDGNEAATNAQVFDAAGARVGTEILVNTQTIGSQAIADLVRTEDGFAVHYSSVSRTERVGRVQRFDDQGGRLGEEANLGARAGDLALLPDGSYALVYSLGTFSDEVYLQRYDASFARVGAAETVNTATALNQNGAVLSVIAGGFVVAYQTSDPAADGSQWAVLMQRYAGTSNHSGDDNLSAPSDLDWTINGRQGDDALTGLGGDDRIVGGGGDDVMAGNSGNDRLVGGRGADTLIGGAGRDVLTGGNGRDTFVFGPVDLGGRAQADRITDFDAPTDTIDLTAIDAIAGGTDDAFIFVGTTRFSGAAGELRYAVRDGFTVIQADVDGDGMTDLMIRLTGNVALTAADFML